MSVFLINLFCFENSFITFRILFLSNTIRFSNDGFFNRDSIAAPKILVLSEFPNKLFVVVYCVLLNKLPLNLIYTLEPIRLALACFGAGSKIKVGLSVF